MNKSDLKIYPMGGVGEIGSNMTVFETENDYLILDYGILFPYDDFFDINYLIVDTTQLDEDKPITLFITHGHEDHIGAIHHFLSDFPDAKVYAPNFARTLILKKLEQRKMKRKIIEYFEDHIIKVDDLEVHPIRVTHSIPDTYGVVIKNPKLDFATLFISDFKFDLNPSFEPPFNTAKLKEVYEPVKKRLAMLDSTNIMVPGKTLSETDLIEDLEKIIAEDGRVFFTLFSSNIFRVRNILELAKKHNRKITTIGRSVNSYLEAASESKLIDLEEFKIKDLDAVTNYNDPKSLYIVTGSQGEFLGASRRIVNGDQKNIKLNDKDRFVFSSKPIPGNEKKIYRMYNDLADQGVEIITFKEMQIHASGHPAQQDLLDLLGYISPTDYTPIHGETYFLQAHTEFIKKHRPNIKIHQLKNFQGLLLKNNEIKYFDLPEKDPILIHGKGIEIERERVSERRKLACNGLIVISMNHKSKNITITTKGLPKLLDRYYIDIKELAHFTAFSQNKNRDHDYTIEQVRIKTRTFCHNILGYKPITIVSMV